MSLLNTISLENEVFRAYAFWSAITVLKMLFMSFWTAKTRLMNKVSETNKSKIKNIRSFLEN